MALAERNDRQTDQRRRDRLAISVSLRNRGFEHAMESVTLTMALETVPAAPSATYDDRLAKFSAMAQITVLDALAALGRRHGWSS